jgi:hypothetical protein
MSHPCSEHELKIGNSIYYNLIHLLNHITKYSTTNTDIICYESVYLVKILDISNITSTKCIKLELTHSEIVNVANFNEKKQIYFSQFNDEPMWKKIDDNTIHFIILYQGCHHTVEKQWEWLG